MKTVKTFDVSNFSKSNVLYPKKVIFRGESIQGAIPDMEINFLRRKIIVQKM